MRQENRKLTSDGVVQNIKLTYPFIQVSTSCTYPNLFSYSRLDCWLIVITSLPEDNLVIGT